jgi:hypothetical protein
MKYIIFFPTNIWTSMLMSCYFQEITQKSNEKFKVILFVSDKDGMKYEDCILENWKEFEYEKEYINFENFDYKNQEKIMKLKKQVRGEGNDVEEIVVSNRVNLRKLKTIFKPMTVTDVEHGVSDLMFWLTRLDLINNKKLFVFRKITQLWSKYRWPAKKHLTLMNKRVIQHKYVYNMNVDLVKSKIVQLRKKYSENNFEVTILIERLDMYGVANAKTYLEQVLNTINLNLKSKNVNNCKVLIKQRYGSSIKVKDFKELIENKLSSYKIYFAIDFELENYPAEYIIFNNDLKHLYGIGFSTALNLNALDVKFKNTIYIDTHLRTSIMILENKGPLYTQIEEKKINERVLEFDSTLAYITDLI